jgi:hypothetical protein
MKILSIDVGIKNLAFCLFEKEDSHHFKIKKWDVINICEPDVYTCTFLDTDSKLCNKPAKFQKELECFCLKHSKKQEYLFPTAETKPTFISKQKIQELCEIADKYKLTYEKPVKKTNLIYCINDYIKNYFFKVIETKNASKADLIDIGSNIKHKFNDLFAQEECIDWVIIENQISPIANRMKTIQGLIVQYFIMSDVLVDNFEFISAINKLKVASSSLTEEKKEKGEKGEKGEKLKYSERKKAGIAKCLEIIANDHRFHEHLQYFNAHKKKDDLADSFLQGLWFIQNKGL